MYVAWRVGVMLTALRRRTKKLVHTVSIRYPYGSIYVYVYGIHTVSVWYPYGIHTVSVGYPYGIHVVSRLCTHPHDDGLNAVEGFDVGVYPGVYTWAGSWGHTTVHAWNLSWIGRTDAGAYNYIYTWNLK